jgi:hypothetical protein
MLRAVPFASVPLPAFDISPYILESADMPAAAPCVSDFSQSAHLLP